MCRHLCKQLSCKQEQPPCSCLWLLQCFSLWKQYTSLLCKGHLQRWATLMKKNVTIRAACSIWFTIQNTSSPISYRMYWAISPPHTIFFKGVFHYLCIYLSLLLRWQCQSSLLLCIQFIFLTCKACSFRMVPQPGLELNVQSHTQIILCRVRAEAWFHHSLIAGNFFQFYYYPFMRYT